MEKKWIYKCKLNIFHNKKTMYFKNEQKIKAAAHMSYKILHLVEYNYEVTDSRQKKLRHKKNLKKIETR